MIEEKRERKYRNAWERLQGVPPVFLVSDLSLRYCWSPRQTATYLHRWRRSSLVRPLGGRSGVFFNLVVSPDWQQHLESAILLAMPSAVEIGPSILHEGGWTTQRSYQRDLALPYRAHAYRVEGFPVHRRGKRWFLAMRKHCMTGEGLPRLTPPAALADLLMRHDASLWLPDPDDLYFEEMEARDVAIIADLLDRLGSPNMAWDLSSTPEENYERLYRLRQAESHESLECEVCDSISPLH